MPSMIAVKHVLYVTQAVEYIPILNQKTTMFMQRQHLAPLPTEDPVAYAWKCYEGKDCACTRAVEQPR